MHVCRYVHIANIITLSHKVGEEAVFFISSSSVTYSNMYDIRASRGDQRGRGAVGAHVLTDVAGRVDLRRSGCGRDRRRRSLWRAPEDEEYAQVYGEYCFGKLVTK